MRLGRQTSMAFRLKGARRAQARQESPHDYEPLNERIRSATHRLSAVRDADALILEPPHRFRKPSSFRKLIS